ncbi:hypothetical protein [Streptomyces sp. NPDC046182]|uniref:hypothetical protein n=1 Tax=Streptomyces sp. NPDC046182 TaxID=3154601 RepID=UPI0033FFE009
MGFFDRLTGTRDPEAGITPRSTEDVRAALLGINAPGVPYAVRHATAAERADLVGEWRVPELRLTLRTRMRFVPAERVGARPRRTVGRAGT